MTQDTIGMLKRNILGNLDRSIRDLQTSIIELQQLGYVTEAGTLGDILAALITERANTAIALEGAPA